MTNPLANSTRCRRGCAACCIAPSITGPIPGMPGNGNKPAGVRCIQLTNSGLCQLFGLPTRPTVCISLQPSPDMCGSDTEHAMIYLQQLEVATKP